MKKLAQIGYYALLTVLFLFIVVFLASLVPLPGNYEIKVVKSGSMEPTLGVGDLVIVYPTDSYDTGDIITFGNDTRREVPTTHRIVEKKHTEGEAEFTTKGDANTAPDPNAVPESSVIGEVVLTVPYVGYVLEFSRKPLGFILIVLLPALIVIFDEFKTIFKEVSRINRRKQNTVPKPYDNEHTKDQ